MIARAHVHRARRAPALRLVSSRTTPKLAETGFRPRRRDLLLLDALQRVIHDGGRISNASLATRLGVTREAIRQRLADPERRAWLNAQLEAAVADAWPKVLARATALAMQGSIRHMELLWALRTGRKTGGAA